MTGFCFKQCCIKPDIAYTTRVYDTSDGSTIWKKNYFQDERHAYNLAGTPTIQKTDESAGENGIVYVGGGVIGNATNDLHWNLIAFDFLTGDKLWERNTAADAPGYDSGDTTSLPWWIRQMQVDPDGNIVVMLLRPYGGDETPDDDDPIFVTVDQAGALVEAKTFTRQTDSNDITIQPFGFTIDDAGKYHIAAKELRSEIVPGPSAVNADRPYFYEWSPSFGSPPTLYDIPDSSGSPLDHVSLSVERFGSNDWLGGTSIHGFGQPPYTTPIDISWLTGALQVSSSGAAQEWADFGLTLPLKHLSLTPETISPGDDGGLNGSDALALEVSHDYDVMAGTALFWDFFDHTIKLPEGSFGDILILRPENWSGGLFYSGFALYPPTSGHIILSRPADAYHAFYFATTNYQYIPTDLPIYAGDELTVGGGFFGYAAYRCYCLESGVWFVEWGGWPIIGWMPYVTDDAIYTVGRFGFVNKWNTSGQLLEWHDCDRVQAVADSSGNTYGLGSRGNSVSKCTITKRNADGTFAWAHKHAGTSINYARMIELSADGTKLIVTGCLDNILPGYITNGPVVPGYDRDYQSNPCQEQDNCPGTCVYRPTNQDAVITERFGSTVRITAIQNCQVDVSIRAGSGGGGGVLGSTGGGGGGGQGQENSATYYLAKDAYIDIVHGTGGAAGRYDEGDANGQNGTATEVKNMDGDVILTTVPGYGGHSDGTKGYGGGQSGSPGIGGGASLPGAGSNGADASSVNGGHGGNASGVYGQGGVWTSYPSAGTDATAGNSSTYSAVGGGGGARATTIIPDLDEGVGGDGSPGASSVTVTTWDWYQTEETDCASGCGCWDLTDVYTELGHPFKSDQVLYLNCIDT